MKQRLRKIETALAFRQPKRSGGMGELYRRIDMQAEKLSKTFQQLLREMEITPKKRIAKIEQAAP